MCGTDNRTISRFLVSLTAQYLSPHPSAFFSYTFLRQHPQRMTHKLYINTRNGIEVIRLDDVAYLKADGNYTEFHLIDGKERVQLSTLSVYADAIARVFSASDTPSPFYRMGRSWIVNLDHVSSVDIQHTTLSFDSSNVKSVAMSRNSLKTLRDYMVELYGI